MKTYLLPSIKLTLLTAFAFGVVYPLLITGIAYMVAPNHGKGKEIRLNGRVVGFEQIGQKFDAPRYFNSRPSAVEYNAAATGGSNKGPTNPEYLALIEERIGTFLEKNPSINVKDIPVDLITASGSGLDPHISPQAAYVQVSRIAKLRNLDEAILKKTVETHVQKPLFGLFGTSTVHVLTLNVALDNLQ